MLLLQLAFIICIIFIALLQDYKIRKLEIDNKTMRNDLTAARIDNNILRDENALLRFGGTYDKRV